MAKRGQTGYIYVLSNPCFKYLKIGHTSNCAQYRADKLSAMQAIPKPFEVEAEYKVDDCVAAERTMHNVLGEYRIGKEFFDIDLKAAIKIIKKIFPGAKSGEDEMREMYGRGSK